MALAGVVDAALGDAFDLAGAGVVDGCLLAVVADELVHSPKRVEHSLGFAHQLAVGVVDFLCGPVAADVTGGDVEGFSPVVVDFGKLAGVVVDVALPAAVGDG